jgi:hypothetical protein
MFQRLVLTSISICTVWSLFFIRGLRKHNVSVLRKVSAYFVKVFHDSIVAFFLISTIYLTYEVLIRKTCHVRYVIALNAVFILIFVLFAVHKMCILTIWYNMLLDKHKCSHYYGLYQLLKGVPVSENNTATYNHYRNSQVCKDNMMSWLEGTKIYAVMILLLNILYVVKLM